MSVTFEPLTDADVLEMSEKMRPMDVFEFEQMSPDVSVLNVLKHLKNKSVRARCGRVDGELVAVYGVLAPTLLSHEGNPWMAATSAVERSDIRRIFLEHTMHEVAWLAEGFDALWNVCSVDNKIAIRWLKWIGFQFEDTIVDVRGHPFQRFYAGV